jgi:hypothetical protein
LRLDADGIADLIMAIDQSYAPVSNRLILYLGDSALLHACHEP